MNRTQCALLALVIMGGVFSFVGCQKEASEEDAKKAINSQQATSDAPSLGNPKPASGEGK